MLSVHNYEKPRKEKTENYVKIRPHTDLNEWMEAVLKFIFKLHQIASLLQFFFSYMISFCGYLLWISFRGYQN